MNNQKIFVLLTGGNLSEDFLCQYYATHPELEHAEIICVDKGLESIRKIGRKPDYIIGDFDSANPSQVLEWEESFCGEEEKFIRLNPVKDETDTHAAILFALQHGAETIYIFGAMGGRMDHFLGNVNLLMIPLKQGVEAYLVDEQNRICLKDQGFTITREECFGTYISFLPMTEKVTHVTMRGFRYEVEDITMTIGTSLGISNEVAKDSAAIEWEDGIFIVVESKDKG